MGEANFTNAPFFSPVLPNVSPGAFYGKLALGIGLVLGVLALLQAAPRQFRKPVVSVLTFLAGLYFVAAFFIPGTGHPSRNVLTQYQGTVTNCQTVLAAFAMGIGVISLTQHHARLVLRRRPGWGNSVALLVSFVAMTVFGLLNEYHPAHVLVRVLGERITNASVYNFLFFGGLSNMSAAMFSMIAFYIASASYRAFRVRSIESTFLMTAALIVMLGSVSFGVMMTNGLPTGESPWANFRIENIAQWLLLQVNAPAQRGILFGLAIGELALGLRIWLSLERSSYFDKEI